jgi:hypothetical protein
VNRRTLILAAASAHLALGAACGGRDRMTLNERASGAPGGGGETLPGSSGGTNAGGEATTGNGVPTESGGTLPGAGQANAAGSSATGSGGSSAAGSSNGGAPVGGMNTSGANTAGTDAAGAGGFIPPPKTVLLLVDDSSTMLQCGDGGSTADPTCATGSSRWALVSEALVEFVQDPNEAGFNVGLRFFPTDEYPVTGCVGYATGAAGNGGLSGTAGAGGMAPNNCDDLACSIPTVSPGPLTADPAPADTYENTLVYYIRGTTPPPLEPLAANPQRPTSAALQGAARWASLWHTEHPDDAPAIALITTGEAAGCDEDPSDIAQIAAIIFANQAVQTFVIGLTGSNREHLDAIARAGNTNQARMVDDGPLLTPYLVSALNDIRIGPHPTFK